jgi:hypothetical protein
VQGACPSFTQPETENEWEDQVNWDELERVQFLKPPQFNSQNASLRGAATRRRNKHAPPLSQGAKHLWPG